MAANAQGLRVIEYEPVLIRNKYQNGYLVLAGRYDSERNEVSIAEDIETDKNVSISQNLNPGGFGPTISGTVPIGYSPKDAKWNVISKGNGKYEIVHCGKNQPLYAASNYFAYDDERRRVFTWKQGPSVTQGYWKFEDAPEKGFYMIKNTEHGEHLYAADYPSKGHVFTWRPKQNDADDDDKFYWQLIKFSSVL